MFYRKSKLLELEDPSHKSPSSMLHTEDEYTQKCGAALYNVPGQRRQITFASPSRSLNRPLLQGCYAAISDSTNPYFQAYDPKYKEW